MRLACVASPSWHTFPTNTHTAAASQRGWGCIRGDGNGGTDLGDDGSSGRSANVPLCGTSHKIQYD